MKRLGITPAQALENKIQSVMNDLDNRISYKTPLEHFYIPFASIDCAEEFFEKYVQPRYKRDWNIKILNVGQGAYVGSFEIQKRCIEFKTNVCSKSLSKRK